MIPSRLQFQIEAQASGSRARAARFRFERDRVRFIAARGALRSILARYMGCAPAALAFSYSAYGKPALAEMNCAQPALSFNLSHSGDWAMCAVAQDRRVGIDIELLRPELATQSIAEHFFSAAEVTALRSLSPAEQIPAFFRCWTRKEAFVKARGEGLSLPLDRFDVSLLPGAPAALLRAADDPQEVSRWSMLTLPAPANYEATLVIEGTKINSSCFHFVPDL